MAAGFSYHRHLGLEILTVYAGLSVQAMQRHKNPYLSVDTNELDPERILYAAQNQVVFGRGVLPYSLISPPPSQISSLTQSKSKHYSCTLTMSSTFSEVI
jgi:hypothetical protein